MNLQNSEIGRSGFYGGDIYYLMGNLMMMKLVGLLSQQFGNWIT